MTDASKMRGIEFEHVEGNPLAIEYRTFDGVQARLVGTDLAYYRYFSGPLGLRSTDSACVREVVDWYARRNAPCFVRLSPLLAGADLLRALSAAGLAQSGFMSLLYGTCVIEEAPPADIRVEAETHTGVLAAAATLPEWRSRGCQTALVRRRLNDAALAGCDLAAVEATPGSASERNLERLGLRLAYTRVIWTREFLLDPE